MISWIGLGVLIIAVAFAVLVVFLVITLVATCRSLKKTNEALSSLEKEAGEVLRHSDELIVDINKKMHSIDPLFGAVECLGEAAKCYSEKKRERAEGPTGTVVEVLKWGLVGATLVQKILSRK